MIMIILIVLVVALLMSIGLFVWDVNDLKEQLQIKKETIKLHESLKDDLCEHINTLKQLQEINEKLLASYKKKADTAWMVYHLNKGKR
jgi:predicted Holliday junction resolvase-like endonuclease